MSNYAFCLFQTSESIKTNVRISCVTSYLTTHTGRPDTHTLLQAPAEWRSLEEARTEAVDRSQRKNSLPQYHTGRLRCTSLATCDRDCTYTKIVTKLIANVCDRDYHTQSKSNIQRLGLRAWSWQYRTLRTYFNRQQYMEVSSSLNLPFT